MSALIFRKNAGAASYLAMVVLLTAGTLHLRQHQHARLGCCDYRTYVASQVDNRDMDLQLYRSVVHFRSIGFYNESRERCLEIIETNHNQEIVGKAREYLETGLLDHKLDDAVQLKYNTAMKEFRDNPELAEKLVRQCLNQDPKFFHAKGSLALMLSCNGQSRQAICLLDEVLRQNPKYARGYFFLSQIYDQLGEADLASTARLKAAKLDPDSMFY